ncbi:M20 family metallopeptidase [Virgibacillus sp. LDC-1]|uniref:M20 metallopeptidase family protein n=1 Tax=Virgibacillus sp. LDC-1 TaxID=3039856 RepID=UPI0024DE5898|nr:M20 family metallopeptidase [Virgibacillus sp. LDC-1]
MVISIKELKEHIRPDVIAMRRHLHQYPELSNKEVNTSQFIKEKLTAYGVSFEEGFAGNGVLGIIKGAQPGKTVALRADMDALPIQETNEHAFVSKEKGIMHACGHDAHTAMLLGTAYMLQQLQAHIIGTVLLIFQPAEEAAPIGGALPMLEDGLFKHYKPDVIYGQHVWPDLPVGYVGIRDREMMGASDRFKLVVKGNGSHASMPHYANDAIVIAGHIVTSIQSIVSRNVDPLEAAVVTIGMIHGGYAPNVIADEVVLEGTVRTYRAEVKQEVKRRFHQITEQIAHAHGGSVEVDYLDGYPATINTEKLAALARNTARNYFGAHAAPDVNPSLAGEDFSRFLEQIPGAFIWLGTQIEDYENQKPLHDPGFELNERALADGSTFMVQLAIDTLNELKRDE